STVSMRITFTASQANLVFAWGGHVASVFDWGQGNSASAISGSSYHQRILQIDTTNIGNQDRSAKVGAILSAPTITTQASAGSVALGGSVSDTATLTGDGTHPVSGSVKFYLCGPLPSAQT